MRAVVIGAHLQREDVEPEARAIACGELFLSGLEIAPDQPLGDRDLLLRVAATRARLLDRATFIAIRYGFSVTSESEAAAKCATHIERWRSLLREHRDDVEMTLKVAASGSKPRPDRRDFSSGADYLRALHEAAQAASIDPAFRAAAEQLAPRHRWIHRDPQSIELVALVRRADVPAVNEAGERLKRELPHVPFLLSGPWPLEVFAE